MFGLVDGFFGEGHWAEAAETALELCLLDELESEEKGVSLDTVDVGEWDY